VKLAIVIGFPDLKSRSLGDFIRESKRGRMVGFVNSIEEAELMLAGK
jgi:hypothetical protein